MWRSQGEIAADIRSCDLAFCQAKIRSNATHPIYEIASSIKMFLSRNRLFERAPFLMGLHRWLLIGLTIILTSGVSLEGQQENAAPPPSGKFTIPLRNIEGVLVCQVFGDRAKLRPDGKKEIEMLQINFYRGTDVDWTLTTPKCILNDQSREAVGDTDVRIFNKKTEITGTGFYWLEKETRFVIRRNVKVIINGGFIRACLESNFGFVVSAARGSARSDCWAIPASGLGQQSRQSAGLAALQPLGCRSFVPTPALARWSKPATGILPPRRLGSGTNDLSQTRNLISKQALKEKDL